MPSWRGHAGEIAVGPLTEAPSRGMCSIARGGGTADRPEARGWEMPARSAKLRSERTLRRTGSGTPQEPDGDRLRAIPPSVGMPDRPDSDCRAPAGAAEAL